MIRLGDATTIQPIPAVIERRCDGSFIATLPPPNLTPEEERDLAAVMDRAWGHVLAPGPDGITRVRIFEAPVLTVPLPRCQRSP